MLFRSPSNPEETAARSLRPLAARLEQPLGAVLTKILDHPGAPLSIIGCRDEDRLAMVWGLREAADNYLLQRGSYPRSWSFSTYEDRHDVSVEGLPEIVFLPARQEGAAPVRRAIVDLSRSPSPPSPNAEIASELVASFLQGRAPRIPEPVRQQVAEHSGVGIYDEMFTVAPSAAPSSGAAHSLGAPTSAAASSSAVQMGGGMPPHAAHGGGAPSEQVRSDGAFRPGPQQRTPPVDQEPLAAVLRAKSLKEFVASLSGLVQSARHFESRTNLRAALDVRAADDLAELVELWSREEMFAWLLEALYGPGFEDLERPDALEHAGKLVKNCQSVQLAMMLAGEAEAAWRKKPKMRDGDAPRPDGDDRRGAARRIKSSMRDTAFERWAADRSVTHVPTGWIAKVYRSGRRNVQLRGAAAAAAVALLMAMFLLGLLVERPAPAQTTDAGATSAPPPTTVTSIVPVPQGLLGIGKVTIKPAEKRQVFGFVKEGDKKYYPQSLCSQGAKGDIWICQVSRALPPGMDGKGLSLVAIEVPDATATELQGKTTSEVIDKRPDEWGGTDVPVEPVS